MTQLSREQFFNAIRDDYFEELGCTMDEFKEMVRAVAPIFGELKVEITEKENGDKDIVFIDVDEADVVFAAEGIDVEDVDTGMTTVALRIWVDKEGIIKIVDHNFKIFTPANKRQVLWYAGLIGKKIEFGGEGNA